MLALADGYLGRMVGFAPPCDQSSGEAQLQQQKQRHSLGSGSEEPVARVRIVKQYSSTAVFLETRVQV